MSLLLSQARTLPVVIFPVIFATDGYRQKCTWNSTSDECVYAPQQKQRRSDSTSPDRLQGSLVAGHFKNIVPIAHPTIIAKLAVTIQVAICTALARFDKLICI